LINLLKRGPVSVAIFVYPGWKDYEEGIFTCKKLYHVSINHMLVLIGLD